MVSLLLAVIYLSFISLGLPDSLLGSAWPVIYPELGVPVSWSGLVFAIISVGTVVSSLMSDRLTKKLGAGKVNALSIATTAVALLGFSFSHHFWQLCLWAIPYGLGAGSVDAALNGYVALHFESRHMSWLHCMWGVGAAVGPYIMSRALTGAGWNAGYLNVGLIQLCICILVFLSLPLWKKPGEGAEGGEEKPLPLKQVLRIPGAPEVLLAFFCYCALEQTVGLWTSSYLVLHKGIEESLAASFAGLFYLGITIGRAVNGFLTFRLSDKFLIRLGQGITLGGLLLMLLPGSGNAALAGFLLTGLGCAPIYPCIIHSTPEHFGKENAQAMIGLQMAGAYAGNTLMPPLFGLIAGSLGVSLLPWFLLLQLAVCTLSYERVVRIAGKKSV